MVIRFYFLLVLQSCWGWRQALLYQNLLPSIENWIQWALAWGQAFSRKYLNSRICARNVLSYCWRQHKFTVRLLIDPRTLAFRRFYEVLIAYSSSILIKATYFGYVLLHCLIRRIECLIYKHSHGMHVKAWIDGIYGVIWHRASCCKIVLVDLGMSLITTTNWCFRLILYWFSFLSLSTMTMLHLGIVVEIIEYLIFFPDQLHVLALKVMLFVCKNNVETWLLLHFVYLRILAVLEFDAEGRRRVRFHLDALLALNRSNG